MEQPIQQSATPQGTGLLEVLKRFKLVIMGVILFLVLILGIFLFILSTPTSNQPNNSPTVPVPTGIQRPPTPTLTQEQIMQDQLKADQNYAEWQKNVIDTYPWYNSLPLQTSSYFVYFDLDKKSFIGKLYPNTNDATPVADQENALKQQIISQLTSLDIPTKQYPILWESHPENQPNENN